MGPEPKTTHQWLPGSLFCINHATIKLLAAPPNRQFKMAEQGILRCRHKAMFASEDAHSTQEREVPLPLNSGLTPIQSPFRIVCPPKKRLDKKKKVVYTHTDIPGLVGDLLP